jgi:hypothetical protein
LLSQQQCQSREQATKGARAKLLRVLLLVLLLLVVVLLLLLLVVLLVVSVFW